MLGFISVKLIVGIIVGAGLGYGYYRLIGCASGSCPLTSNPWVTTIYGAGLGLLFTLGGK